MRVAHTLQARSLEAGSNFGGGGGKDCIGIVIGTLCSEINTIVI